MSKSIAVLPAGRSRNTRRRSSRAAAALDERQLSLAFDAELRTSPDLAGSQRIPKPPVGPAAPEVPPDQVPEERKDSVDALDPSDAILRLPAVKAKTGLGRSAIYDGMDQGTFPRQRKIGARAVGWSAAAIQKWIDARPRAKE